MGGHHTGRTGDTGGRGGAHPAGQAGIPTVGIVILNWNRFDLVAACIRSIQAADHANTMIVVVDNGSADGSAARLRETFPTVAVIENGVNLGFAGANNVGIDYLLAAGVDCVMLLNDDTEIDPDMIPLLTDTLYSDERIGIVGPTIYYFDERQTVWFAGGTIDRLGQVSHPGADLPGAGRPGQPGDVDYICGCALMVKSSVLRQVGRLDERFFLYYEETEFCTRVRANGYRVVLVPRASMWHKVRPGDRPSSPTYLYLMARNRLLYLRCTGAGIVTLTAAVVSILRTAASWAVRPRHRRMRPHARVLVRAVRDFLLGRLGPPPHVRPVNLPVPSA